mgnify:CR=1 FL=1
MDYQLLKVEVEQKTAQTLEVLKNEYAGLRTGRASVHLLDAVRVPVYGSEMPINQVATVSTPDNQTLSVTVWDITNAPAVEKAIRDSGLGLNPMTAGGVIRLNMPPLTEERRRELTKVAGKYAEEAKTRWGSMKSDGSLRLNAALMHCPPPLIDYVIVHELSHRVHMNHSPAFHAHTEKYLPDARQRRAALKQCGAYLTLLRPEP